jgi:hypothetical protein
VNDYKLIPEVERELFENDVIGLGVTGNVDTSDRTNFVFRLLKSFTVEINSDDDSKSEGKNSDSEVGVNYLPEQNEEASKMQSSLSPVKTVIASNEKQEKLRHLKQKSKFISEKRKKRVPVVLNENKVEIVQVTPQKRKRGRPKKQNEDRN